MLFFKLDYVLEMEDARQRAAAQCAAYARPRARTFTQKLNRLAKQLAGLYLTHQSWKAHDGLSVSVAAAPTHARAQVTAAPVKNHRRTLRKLAGVRLSAAAAQAVWPR